MAHGTLVDTSRVVKSPPILWCQVLTWHCELLWLLRNWSHPGGTLGNRLAWEHNVLHFLTLSPIGMVGSLIRSRRLCCRIPEAAWRTAARSPLNTHSGCPRSCFCRWILQRSTHHFLRSLPSSWYIIESTHSLLYFAIFLECYSELLGRSLMEHVDTIIS